MGSRGVLILAALSAMATVCWGVKCDDLFETESLRCETCSLIEENQPGLSELVKECKACCTGEVENAYSAATIELDERQRAWAPELDHFLATHADSFPKLKVRYSFNKRPTLIMTRATKSGSTTTDRVPIAAWKSSQIVEYLKAKLA
eukprot:TRINITY_DN2048_c7_g1_i1.p1 TRINITY_DN2048_c7_g1~~TRINITY_DN2048_c7_g1_i1.p1  ORF type:complete len:165 (+),score=36.55 TRINITY_DN2048_c7_g1_i1:56-496(+)